LLLLLLLLLFVFAMLRTWCAAGLGVRWRASLLAAFILAGPAAAICERREDVGKTSVFSATLKTDGKGKVTAHLYCGDDAALAAARAATSKRTATKDGEAVLAFATALQELLDKEAVSGSVGYLAPAVLDQGLPTERPRVLKTGGLYSRRAVDHGRKEEYQEAVADLLRSLLKQGLDETARDRLFATMVDFLKKAAKRLESKAQDGDLSDLFEALDIEDEGKDNAEVDKATLKKVYREMSVKYHPDKNPDAGQLFNRIRDAYEILSDPVKTLLYDTGGAEVLKQYEKGSDEVERTENLELAVGVTLAEVYGGIDKVISVSRRVVCRSCRLRPDLPRCKKCGKCPGEMGRRQVWMNQHQYQIQEYEIPSPEKCSTAAERVTVHVERGMQSGDRVEYPHMSNQLPKQIPGAILVAVNIANHRNDLRIEVRVSLYEALLGFEREVVHLDGHLVKFSVPRGDVLKPGFGLAIQDEGMPVREDPSSFGRLLVKFEVDFPDSVPAEAEGALESALRAIGQGPGPVRVDGSGAAPKGRGRSEL